MVQPTEFPPKLKVGARHTYHNMRLKYWLSADHASVNFRTLDNELATDEERGSVSLGNDFRLDSERFAGAGLEFEDQIIQFSLFGSGDGNGNGPKPQRRMRKASASLESRGR
jgi:hypothetical protein